MTTAKCVCDGCGVVRLCRIWPLRGWFCNICEAIRLDGEDRIRAR